MNKEITSANLMAAATAETGLDDFDGTDFLEPMDRFLQSALTESKLTATGLEILEQNTLRMLVNRLMLKAEISAHPQIIEDNVLDPIIIIGNPRTGTTKLQRMMAASPAFQFVAQWQTMFPALLPGTNRENDPRIQITRDFGQQLAEQHPEFMVAHELDAEAPEEEAMLLQMTFELCTGLSWFYWVPSFHQWLLDADRSQVPVYRYLKKVLQYFQWFDGGRKGRPWVLKTPLHTAHIDALLEVFPNATLVHCHRDPVETVPSFCSLNDIIYRSYGQTVDPLKIGPFMLSELARHWQENLHHRKKMPASAKIIDVAYQQIKQSPDNVIRKILSTAGLEPQRVGIEHMLGWQKNNPPQKFGKHRYALEQFGMTPLDIEETFQFYFEQFPEMRV